MPAKAKHETKLHRNCVQHTMQPTYRTIIADTANLASNTTFAGTAGVNKRHAAVPTAVWNLEITIFVDEKTSNIGHSSAKYAAR